MRLPVISRPAILLYGLLFYFFCSCKPSEPAVSGENSLPLSNPVGCLVEATVIQILPGMYADSTHICHTRTCFAKVRIDEVLKRGAASDYAIAAGTELKVFFVFTLQPADEKDIEGLKKSYPGLREGEHFRAVILSSLGANNEKEYLVYDYTKLE